MTGAGARYARARALFPTQKPTQKLKSMPSSTPIDISRRSLRLSRRQVRELLKQITAFCCGAAGPVTFKRSLELLEKCVDPEEAPQLAALLEFAGMSGRITRSTSVRPL